MSIPVWMVGVDLRQTLYTLHCGLLWPRQPDPAWQGFMLQGGKCANLRTAVLGGTFPRAFKDQYRGPLEGAQAVLRGRSGPWLKEPEAVLTGAQEVLRPRGA